MTIRTRLTLWYALILSGSLVLIALGTYREILEQARSDRPAESARHALKESGEMILQVGLPALVLGLAGGWWLTRKTLAPVSALTRAAERVHEKNLHEQLPRSGSGDELDRLTEVFNAMTARLDSSFQRIREFTLHASHELKTPLTIMQGELETELMLESPGTRERERLLSQLDEVRRLTKIVDGLTLLAKADAGQIQLDRQPVRLDELVRDAFDDAKILAQPHRVTVSLGACEPAVVQGDRDRLRQLLLNLSDNAVKYNRPGGTVRMELLTKSGQVEVTMINTSAGVPPELLGRVFDRFFRCDSSHNNGVDGCGLGLSIAQWIAVAHAGTIKMSSTAGAQTAVTVTFPLSGKND